MIASSLLRSTSLLLYDLQFVLCISECLCVCASMMASSLLRSTSDFLASGVDKCLDQLYDCTDLQSPDSSCSSTSDNSRLGYNTRAAFERRYLAR